MAVQVRKLFSSLMLFVLGLFVYMVYVIHLSSGRIGNSGVSKYRNIVVNYSIDEASNGSKGTDYTETIYVSDLIRKRVEDVIVGRQEGPSDTDKEPSAALVTSPTSTSVEQHEGKPSVPETKPSSPHDHLLSVQLPTQPKVNVHFPGIHGSWQKQVTLPIVQLRKRSEHESLVPNGVARNQQSVPTVSSHDTSQAVYSSTGHSGSLSSTASSSNVVDPSGYVLAVGIYEQQTIACKNLLQLQCWAASLGMSVVKPVMKDSFLKTPLSDDAQRASLKFEDFFDLADWNRQTKNHYSMLVNWSDFLSNAPRKVIIVRFTYPSVSLLKLRQRAGEAVIHAAQGERYKNGCNLHWPAEYELQYLQSKGFDVVRTVCLNFYYGDKLSEEAFNAHILGEFSPSEVTIAMEMWRGIGSGQRVLIRHSCEYVPAVNERIAPSDRQVRDAKAYVKEYLGGEPYLAIIGRLEMSMLTVHSSSPVIPYCLEATHKKWDQLQREMGLQRTFLSIDIGRYGSKRFRYHLDPTLRSKFVHFFQSIYGPSATVKDWESTFENVSGLTDAGYIGLLQKVIVTRAKCILFVGGGAFQRHALHLYQMGHPDPNERCVHVVNECTSSTKLRLA